MTSNRLSSLMRLWSLLTIAIISSSPLEAQTGEIYGRVTDSKTGQLLAGANITVEEVGIGATSADDGRFALTGVPAGQYELSISVIGYHIHKQTISVPLAAPLKVELISRILPGQEVVVSVSRARLRVTPVPFTDIPRRAIEEASTAQDIPMLLQSTPNLYSYSDAGNGIGYSYLSLRGFDQRRTNVSINGISLNDPEDHQVYWVDMPNLIANVADIQVQRGIGSSLYGRNAFGGSINLVTSSFPAERAVKVEGGMGSYNTRTGSFSFNSGLVDNSYSFYGRFSRISTDGYRYDSWSKMWSYFFSASRYGKRSTLTINLYGGPEQSHAAWNASAESVLQVDHRDNPYSFYAGETDNFNQPHYELHHEWRPSDVVTLKQAFYYIRGEGFFEQLKVGAELAYYGIEPLATSRADLFGADSLGYYETRWARGVGEYLYQDAGQYRILRSDIVRERWVKKNQIGWSPHLSIRSGKGELNLGGEVNLFDSDHFGKILGGKYLPDSWDPQEPYYRYNGNKFWVSPYVNLLYNLGHIFTLTGELQLQHKRFKFAQREAGGFTGALLNRYDLKYTFISPRIGLNANLTPALSAFAYAGKATREPSDGDLYDRWSGPHDLGVKPLFANVDTVRGSGGSIAYLQWSDPLTKPERLTDFELGVNFAGSRMRLAITAYHMLLEDEIIALGGVDRDGLPVRGNADRTIHQGIELDGQLALPLGVSIGGNLAISRNVHDKFIIEGGAEPLDYSGNPIPLFPSLLGNGWLRWSGGGLAATLSLRTVGQQYLDSTGDADRVVDAYSVANLRLLWRLPALMGVSGTTLKVAVDNLLDRRYETSGYWADWANERYLYPAAGRNVSINVQVSL